jgi:hypothetical protein
MTFPANRKIIGREPYNSKFDEIIFDCGHVILHTPPGSHCSEEFPCVMCLHLWMQELKKTEKVRFDGRKVF